MNFHFDETFYDYNMYVVHSTQSGYVMFQMRIVNFATI